MNSIKCLKNLSLKNLKMIVSTITAPIAPKNAVDHTDVTCAISPSITIAGAVVNAEVKNMPAIKLPNNSSSLVEVRIFMSIPVLPMKIAITILKAIITKSFIKK